jgi:hypothetical protein
MTRKKHLLIASAIVFAVMQFFGPRPNNPPTIESHTIESELKVPTRIENMMSRACMDCHSHQTHWPWYSRVAPVRWWLVNHVNRGRKDIDFSEWMQYPPGFVIGNLRSMGQAVERNVMPLDSYIILHPAAKLSDEERKCFSDWALTEAQHLQKIGLDASNQNLLQTTNNRKQ